MENKQVIESKITSLGSIKKNPRCKLDVNHLLDSSSLTRLESICQEIIPDVFKSFYEKYGAFSFNKDVGIKCLDKKPIWGDENVVSANYFHSFEQGAECSIDSILSIYPELLRQKLLPIMRRRARRFNLYRVEQRKVILLVSRRGGEREFILSSGEFYGFHYQA